MEHPPGQPNAERRALLVVALHACLVLVTIKAVTFLAFSAIPVLESDWRAYHAQLFPCLRWLVGLSCCFFKRPGVPLLVFEVTMVVLLFADWRFCRMLVRQRSAAHLAWYSCGIAALSIAVLSYAIVIVGGYLQGWGKDKEYQWLCRNQDWVHRVFLSQETRCTWDDMPLQEIIAKWNEGIDRPRRRIVLKVDESCQKLRLTYTPTVEEGTFLRLAGGLDILCMQLRDVHHVDASWGIENDTVVVHCRRPDTPAVPPAKPEPAPP